MKPRGRPLLGAFSGLILGFLIALDLSIFHVRAPDNLSVIGLPAIGFVLGFILGMWPPFARKRSVIEEPPMPPGLEALLPRSPRVAQDPPPAPPPEPPSEGDNA